MEKFQELEDEVQAVRDQLQVGYACRQQWGEDEVQAVRDQLQVGYACRQQWAGGG